MCALLASMPLFFLGYSLTQDFIPADRLNCVAAITRQELNLFLDDSKFQDMLAC